MFAVFLKTQKVQSSSYRFFYRSDICCSEIVLENIWCIDHCYLVGHNIVLKTVSS